MNPEVLFYILIGILIFDFTKETVLSLLNAQHFKDKLPEEIADVYDSKAYEKSQAYKKENHLFTLFRNGFSLTITLAFFWADGFLYVDSIARYLTSNEILITLYFLGGLFFVNDLIYIPFSYYKTFVIEEKYGFNRTTRKLFFIDKIKSWLLMSCLGGLLISFITWLYLKTGNLFWIYTWMVVSLFSLFINLFYSSLLVPLFNKQSPLEEGILKTKLENFALKVGFQLDKIFVIDGSKRSSKANAYFSGFGPKKRIVFYDTLIHDLSTDEIVAVFAHEIGHSKRKHVFYNIALSTLITGLTLFILSILIDNPLLAASLGVSFTSFHIGILVFSILYTPLSDFTGMLLNIVSRIFEYQADNYAKENSNANDLIHALKKLSKNSLSNLTPHKSLVYLYYSHPTLLQRIQNLNK
jgi:STE24 endopeptidase